MSTPHDEFVRKLNKKMQHLPEEFRVNTIEDFKTAVTRYNQLKAMKLQPYNARVALSGTIKDQQEPDNTCYITMDRVQNLNHVFVVYHRQESPAVYLTTAIGKLVFDFGYDYWPHIGDTKPDGTKTERIPLEKLHEITSKLDQIISAGFTTDINFNFKISVDTTNKTYTLVEKSTGETRAKIYQREQWQNYLAGLDSNTRNEILLDMSPRQRNELLINIPVEMRVEFLKGLKNKIHIVLSSMSEEEKSKMIKGIEDKELKQMLVEQHVNSAQRPRNARNTPGSEILYATDSTLRDHIRNMPGTDLTPDRNETVYVNELGLPVNSSGGLHLRSTADAATYLAFVEQRDNSYIRDGRQSTTQENRRLANNEYLIALSDTRALRVPHFINNIPTRLLPPSMQTVAMQRRPYFQPSLSTLAIGTSGRFGGSTKNKKQTSNESVKYKGKKYKIREGKRGGKYILVNGEKKYIKTKP